jgi:hypothetical protein
MGGRANAGNTKMFSNIDAARNTPLRATRAKEIEADRAAKPVAATTKTSTNKSWTSQKGRLIGKGSSIEITTGFERGKYIPPKGGNEYTPGGKFEEIRKTAKVNSIAHVGRLHLHPAIDNPRKFNLTDSKSGYALRTGLTKTQGLDYLKSSVRKDGSLSRTMERHLNFYTDKANRQQKFGRPYEAYSRLRKRIEGY